MGTMEEAILPRLRTRRLLLVDDEADVRGLYKQMLEDAGFEVVAVGGAHEAAREVLAGKFDVAIVDERMARVRGMAFVRWLRRRHPEVKSVLASAYADWDMYFRACTCGAADVISKSHPVSELIRVARQVTA